MLTETINNLHWAITFSICTTVLNLVSIGMLTFATRNMRRAAQTYRDLASRIEARSDATGTGAAAGESLIGGSRDAQKPPNEL